MNNKELFQDGVEGLGAIIDKAGERGHRDLTVKTGIGAGAGAVIGSFFGPVGAVVGAAIGASTGAAAQKILDDDE